MNTWLHLARGPLFWTALAFMVLGLVRQLGLTLWETARVYRRAGDKDLPVGRVVRETGSWLVPVRHFGKRWPYSLTTFVFHVGVILVPLLLAGHVELWRAGLGISWPALPNVVSTTLTLLVIAAALALVLERAIARASRALGRFSDYALPLFIAVPFVSGLLVMHPTWNPFATDPTLLVHVLSADVLLFLVPLTKLSHMILFPLTQLVSEMAWHFPPDAGSRVAATLGKEGEPI
jgi:nitrate reductase gamma subunit